MEIYHRTFLTSTLHVGEWSASRPGRFTPGESPRYPLDGRLCGPQSRGGCGGEEKNALPSRESNLGRPARSLGTILTELFRLVWDRREMRTKF
jgi:hypothetical protein